MVIGSPPVERCLACEAVVNKDNLGSDLSPISALARVQLGILGPNGDERTKSSDDTERGHNVGMTYELALFTKASQARQRSTGDDP